jgi:hypothetical protein
MSARRIRAYDHDLRPSRVVPQRPVDFGTIDSDVRNALKYIKGAKYAIEEPDLCQHIGAFVSDDIVPVSLHHEVSDYQRQGFLLSIHVASSWPNWMHWLQQIRRISTLARMERSVPTCSPPDKHSRQI